MPTVSTPALDAAWTPERAQHHLGIEARRVGHDRRLDPMRLGKGEQVSGKSHAMIASFAAPVIFRLY
jgi:hypothetical protein